MPVVNPAKSALCYGRFGANECERLAGAAPNLRATLDSNRDSARQSVGGRVGVGGGRKGKPGWWNVNYQRPAIAYAFRQVLVDRERIGGDAPSSLKQSAGR